ncbi:FG-GAP-like repeat-containing protein [Aureimonas altamirensis]|uniref:FG-GAP-like repeat-containing protein n=1 Tax=Aureimonas altamirensis TaxID=370622 RepID=UPI00203761E1|nr:FG-GAP-like repeat-containing protein [Aureimonas altamirensis]
MLGRSDRTSANVAVMPDTVSITVGQQGAKLGYSVSAAGDVNGDGYQDVIIAAPGISNGAGEVFVVFGSSHPWSLIDLDAPVNGLRIFGGISSGSAGLNVTGIGDVNGDGIADIAVSSTDGVYVLFGRVGNSGIAVSAVRTGNTQDGYFIDTTAVSTLEAPSVSSAGDLNGDGRSDILIGFGGADNGQGRTFVLYGTSQSDAVTLSSISTGSSGFFIGGAAAGDRFGVSVAAAGDVNADGYDDLLIGAPGKGTFGVAYVLFGGSDGPYTPATMVEYDGTSDPDTFNSDGLPTTIMGRAGPDQIYMTAPDSVGYGGAGDDTFLMHASFLASLENPSSTAVRSSRIDGGSGIDTLKMAPYTGNNVIDLSLLTGGSSTVSGDGRLENIEIIDLGAGQGANELRLTEASIVALSRADVFQQTGLVQLMVKGDSADTFDAMALTDRPGYTFSEAILDNEVYHVVGTDVVQVFVQDGIHIVLP